MKTLNEIVSANLIELRKSKHLTQQELAEKFSYSDKTISKWELGYAIPSVEILKQLGDFYGVTLDYFITEPNNKTREKMKKKKHTDDTRKYVIAALCVTIAFLIATVVFVWGMFQNKNFYMAFVWAVPASLLALIFLSLRWWRYSKIAIIVIGSLFIWSMLLSAYFQFFEQNIWYIFFIGVPLEPVLILLTQMKNR